MYSFKIISLKFEMAHSTGMFTKSVLPAVFQHLRRALISRFLMKSSRNISANLSLSRMVLCLRRRGDDKLFVWSTVCHRVNAGDGRPGLAEADARGRGGGGSGDGGDDFDVGRHRRRDEAMRRIIADRRFACRDAAFRRSCTCRRRRSTSGRRPEGVRPTCPTSCSLPAGRRRSSQDLRKCGYVIKNFRHVFATLLCQILQNFTFYWVYKTVLRAGPLLM